MTLIIIGIVLIVLSLISAVVNMVTGVTSDRDGKSFVAIHGAAIVGNVIGWALIAIGVLVLLV